MKPCKLWTGARTRDGYGTLRYAGRTEYVHRLTYRLEVGPIPRGAEVTHTCDQPACYEVTHLVARTHAANMADMAEKGRARNGTSNGRARARKRRAA